ncbi:MMPL family transporter [Angustibacter sp. McL0619]|uniref:MMPL family transporter n=1 Tax=Angustibacter sp. McL0619 TaxID=3415676 RepID=UPI003CEEC27B
MSTGGAGSGTPEPGSRLARARETRRRAGRRRAVVRAIGLTVVAAAWLGVVSVGGPLVGRLSEVQQNDNANFLPKSAESTKLAEQAEKFSDTTAFPAFLVVERAGGLSPDDRSKVQQLTESLPSLRVPVDPASANGRTYTLEDFLVPGPIPVVPSEDGEALLVPISLDGDKAGDSLPDGESVVGQSVATIRTAAAAQLEPSGLKTYVTGPAGFTADLVTAFGGIDGKLLAVSLTAVFLILLLVYRSPLLPVAALMTSAFGLSAAAMVIFPLAKRGTIALNGQSQGILFILVIGAATDYALLLVSRYREELHDHENKYVAMRRAWRGSVQPIAASATTVVLGLLCLMLSELGSTRGLGPVGAIGIIGALLAALTLLPVLLLLPTVVLGIVVCGAAFALGTILLSPVLGMVLVVAALGGGGYLAWRRWQVLRGPPEDGPLPWYAKAPSGRWLFWPRTPHVDHVHREDVLQGNGIWGRVARLVGRHPRAVWGCTLAVLLVAGLFAPTLKASGISTSDLFRQPVESVQGQQVLADHFPGGSGSPAVMVVQETDTKQALEVVRAVDGVASAQVLTDATMATPTAPGPPKVVDGQVELQATLEPAADTPEAEDVVLRLRSAVDVVGQDVLVGGNTAVNLDIREASQRDLKVIIPAILLVIALVLMMLLRAVVAPLLLIGANVVSFGATIGISALVFNHVFHFPGGDPSIPLYAFVFLVALGIDYSIFLMTRVREEAGFRGTREGVLVGLAVTGGVITSAGVVLAATFGSLATIPILFLQQIAFIVAFGVLLDTLVVRSLLVPALSHDIGSRIWWPTRYGSGEDPDAEAGPADAAAVVEPAGADAEAAPAQPFDVRQGMS